MGDRGGKKDKDKSKKQKASRISPGTTPKAEPAPSPIVPTVRETTKRPPKD